MVITKAITNPYCGLPVSQTQFFLCRNSFIPTTQWGTWYYYSQIYIREPKQRKMTYVRSHWDLNPNNSTYILNQLFLFKILHYYSIKAKHLSIVYKNFYKLVTLFHELLFILQGSSLPCTPTFFFLHSSNTPPLVIPIYPLRFSRGYLFL